MADLSVLQAAQNAQQAAGTGIAASVGIALAAGIGYWNTTQKIKDAANSTSPEFLRRLEKAEERIDQTWIAVSDNKIAQAKFETKLDNIDKHIAEIRSDIKKVLDRKH